MRFSIIFILLFCTITSCSSPRINIGLQSSFLIQDHHSWIEDIKTHNIESYQKCCDLSDLQIYLHRVIQDERGWYIYIGAGDNVSKEELISSDNLTLENSILVSNNLLHFWDYPYNENEKIIRYAYNEPNSGLLITLDFVVQNNKDLQNTKSLIEKDVSLCLKIR